MKKSTAITLTLLGSAMLVAWCGCGGLLASRSRKFYDAAGNAVPRNQWMTAENKPNTLYDDKGQPVPPEEIQSAYASTSGTTTTTYRSHHYSPWGWSPFYSSRAWSTYPHYSGTSSTRSSTNTGSTYFGGSKPNTTSPSTFKSSVSGSGTSRGGFGGTSSGGSSSS